MDHRDTGERSDGHAPYVLDATETGELLPLTGGEHVTGFESSDDTGEPSAPDEAQPLNMQAVSVCFAVDHVDGDHAIDKPGGLRLLAQLPAAVWGGPLLSWRRTDPRTLATPSARFAPNPEDDPQAIQPTAREGGDVNLWTFRRIAARRNFVARLRTRATSRLVNWPHDRLLAAARCSTCRRCRASHLERARDLSLSFLYWMQTEAPRPDGGTGFPGTATARRCDRGPDGLAMAPYIRESRRIRAQYTVVEQDLSLRTYAASRRGAAIPDSVGVGMYRIDLHPSTGGDDVHRHRLLAVPDPARCAAAAALTNLIAGGQEHRHHPHHQRLLPAAPGGVEHRRGGRNAGRTLPRHRPEPAQIRSRRTGSARLPAACCSPTASNCTGPGDWLLIDVARIRTFVSKEGRIRVLSLSKDRASCPSTSSGRDGSFVRTPASSD